MKGVCIRSTEYRVVESRVRRECGWKRPTQKGRKRLCWTTPVLCIILDLFYKLPSVASLFIYFCSSQRGASICFLSYNPTLPSLSPSLSTIVPWPSFVCYLDLYNTDSYNAVY
ncbi:uncharacterized protein ASPGLDRAFT_494649 [Aspergillus glaucus CBS 516.65]|uniref:Uncharacterized protein n=1 Tax=Aspergillus glaucus CBS 516.65 TaxID=1160497 RepID=A0A1L9VFS0_ASPGL|nr:hypothetical protein ASPGLDRAFT_494649 [Aspergillus glaucus CBS 516.65]OJJ82759.1 hypothetical protein ASPGLDRAFT_494649 [Aspergillus glaucus CBS 516.65]